MRSLQMKKSRFILNFHTEYMHLFFIFKMIISLKFLVSVPHAHETYQHISFTRIKSAFLHVTRDKIQSKHQDFIYGCSSPRHAPPKMSHPIPFPLSTGPLLSLSHTLLMTLPDSITLLSQHPISLLPFTNSSAGQLSIYHFTV